MSVWRWVRAPWVIAAWVALSCPISIEANAESVAGESLIEVAGAVEDVIEELMQQPISRAEIDQFVSDAEVFLEWTSSNVDQWVAADELENPLEAIRAFEVWKSIDSTASAFLATLVKLMLARDFASQQVSAAGLQKEIAEMERILKSGNLSGYVLGMAQTEIAEKRRTLEFLRGVAPKNQKLYKANRERIDPILYRFEQIGQ
ncbi:MAG: hypothetical protein VYC82_04585 [Verrucomicrobiota bacterium]|nr:hypothetical protein [Verrucomicrobiota bacterium]